MNLIDSVYYLLLLIYNVSFKNDKMYERKEEGFD